MEFLWLVAILAQFLLLAGILAFVFFTVCEPQPTPTPTPTLLSNLDTVAYRYTPNSSSAGTYSHPHTFAYHYARTSSIPAADPNSDPTAVGVIYIGSSSSYIPLNSAPNAYPNAGASGTYIYSILE